MKKSIALALVGAVVLGACSQPAKKIDPSYVSRTANAGLTCNELMVERNNVVGSLNTLMAKQNASARNDVAAVTVGAVLFWPATLAVLVKDSSVDLAAAKGSYDALTERMVENGCKVPAEPLDESNT